MVNAESTAKNMAQTFATIAKPAYEYFDQGEVQREIDAIKQRHDQPSKIKPVRYRTSNQIHEELEELAIAEQFDELKNVKDLTHLLRGGEMKEFYKVANKVLKIKRSNPVVTKV